MSSEPPPAATTDDPPPHFKYRVLSGPALDLGRLKVTCAAAQENLIVLGTSSGILHLLDPQGRLIKRVPAHTDAVSGVALDDIGETVASCAVDGTIAISSASGAAIQRRKASAPLTAIAVEPQYASSPRQALAFASAHDGLLLWTREHWFGPRDTTLDPSTAISIVRWSAISHLAWASPLGVRVYDAKGRQPIVFVERPAVRPRAPPPCLAWRSDTELIVGWDNTIQVLRVLPRVPSAPHLPTKVVERVSVFQIESRAIVGLAAHGRDAMVLLLLRDDRAEPAAPPELFVITDRGRVDFSDPIKAFQEDVARVASEPHEPWTRFRLLAPQALPHLTLALLSPWTLLAVAPLDPLDRMRFFLEGGRLEGFLRAADEWAATPGGRHNDPLPFDVAAIRRTHVRELLRAGHADRAAAMIATHGLAISDANWTEWAERFIACGQPVGLARVLPADGSVGSALFTRLAQAAFDTGHLTEMCDLIAGPWRAAIDVEAVRRVLVDELERCLARGGDAPAMLTALAADMAGRAGRCDEALELALRLAPETAPGLVQRFGLANFARIPENGARMVQANAAAAIPLLVEHAATSGLAPRLVEDLARTGPGALIDVFHRLFLRGQQALTAPYGDLQLRLYVSERRTAEFRDFLRGCGAHTNFKLALRLCREHGLHESSVVVYDRLGSVDEALNVLVSEIADPDKTIDYAMARGGDPAVWEALVARWAHQPAAVERLLQRVGPTRPELVAAVLQHLPPEADLPHWTRHAREACAALKLQIRAVAGARDNLRHQLADEVARRLLEGCGGATLDPSDRCEAAQCLVEGRRLDRGDLVVYPCQHGFHWACGNGGRACPVCWTGKKPVWS